MTGPKQRGRATREREREREREARERERERSGGENTRGRDDFSSVVYPLFFIFKNFNIFRFLP